MYRPCIASFEADLQEPETNTMGSKLKDDFEPYWDDEKDWLCTVEFLPRGDPEARSFSAEIMGYPVWLRTSHERAFTGTPWRP